MRAKSPIKQLRRITRQGRRRQRNVAPPKWRELMADEFTNFDENEETQRKAAEKGGNGAAHEEEATPLSAEELAALGGAARDLMPEESFLVGKPLRWSYETGQWYEEAVDGKNKVQVDI